MNLRAIFSQRLIATTDGSRIPAYELLLDSPRVRDLILKGEIHELKETMEKSHNLGMRTFDSSIFEIYCSGKISVDEALRNADSAHNLKLRIQLSSEPDKEFNPAHNVSSISAEDFRLD
jgi:twitching motility protein PilU